MMWVSYDIQMCTKIDINISHMEMNILNTFPKIWIMWVKNIYMCIIGQQKFLLDANHAKMQTYNKMHSRFNVQLN
jgi:hypothetical protein